MTTLAAGTSAPDFTLTGIDGRRFALKEGLAAGSLLLVFFKTTCPACDLAFPYLAHLQESYPQGWQIWSISQDSPPRTAEYALRFALPFPVLVDEDGYPVSKAYDPPSTPTLYLIEADGSIAYTTHGFSKDDINELSALIAQRLGVEKNLIAPPDDGQPRFRPG